MITLRVTEQQADLILNALGMRPFLEVNGLINDLLQQGRNQPQEVQPVMPAVPDRVVNGAAAPQ